MPSLASLNIEYISRPKPPFHVSIRNAHIFCGETRKCPHAGFSQRHHWTPQDTALGGLPGPQVSSGGRNGCECGRCVCSWDRTTRPVGCWLLPSLKGWVVTSIVELCEGWLDFLCLISWVSVLTRLRVWCWRMRRNRGLGCFRRFLPFAIIIFLVMDHLQDTQSSHVSSSVTRWIELSTRDSGIVGEGVYLSSLDSLRRGDRCVKDCLGANTAANYLLCTCSGLPRSPPHGVEKGPVWASGLRPSHRAFPETHMPSRVKLECVEQPTGA